MVPVMVPLLLGQDWMLAGLAGRPWGCPSVLFHAICFWSVMATTLGEVPHRPVSHAASAAACVARPYIRKLLHEATKVAVVADDPEKLALVPRAPAMGLGSSHDARA